MSNPRRANEEPEFRRPPARTAAGREKQLIGLAVDLAAKQLSEGTASSQVISHFLKLATEKEKTEIEILRMQKELIKAKTENIRNAQMDKELYKNAIDAMRSYGGHGHNEDDED